MSPRQTLGALLLLHGACGMLTIPANATRVIINIGSHTTPVLPPSDGTTIVLAFEPVVGCRIKPRPRLYIINAAVAAEASLSTMGVYNTGKSSSLSAAVKSMPFARAEAPSIIVPVLSIQTVLASVPAAAQIWLLKTDMQGWDCATLVGAGPVLRRVHYVRAEAFLANTHSYEGPQNDFCLNLLPSMLRLGFEFLHMHGNSGARGAVNGGKGVVGLDAAHAYCALHASDEPRPGLLEGDAYFRRAGTTLPPPGGGEWPSKARGL